MKIGRTIGAEREKAESESERIAIREKEQRRKKTSGIIFFAVLLLLIVLTVGVIMNVVQSKKKDELPEFDMKKYTPTVQIIDESGSNYVTDKMKNYVGMIEQDFYDLGMAVEKAIIPVDKTREVDIYIAGRDEYYKCNLDRPTAETAEDAERMFRYLNEKEIKATYVDVRIPGRAYYK